MQILHRTLFVVNRKLILCLVLDKLVYLTCVHREMMRALEAENVDLKKNLSLAVSHQNDQKVGYIFTQSIHPYKFASIFV